MKDDKQNYRQGVALSQGEAYTEFLRTRKGNGQHEAWVAGVNFARSESRASSSRAEVEIPKGYVLAPRASTDKMNAAGKAAAKGFHHSHADYIDAIYEAMLAAAEAPKGEQS